MSPPKVVSGGPDWGVCKAPTPPPPPPPEALVCVAPPKPAPVCSMPAQASTLKTTSTPAHSSSANQVDFGHGSTPASGHDTHATGGHGHSAAADISHATHVPHQVHQGLDLIEGGMHSAHAAHGAKGAAQLGVGSGLVKAGGIALAPIVIIGGGAQIVDGFQKGGADGTYDVLQGSTGVVGGTATLLAAGGGTGVVATGAATVAPVAAAAGVGLAVGRYGDETSKTLFSDGRGVSDRLGDAMWDANQAVGGGWKGHVAAGVTGIALLPGAGVLAVGSAVVGAAKWLNPF